MNTVNSASYILNIGKLVVDKKKKSLLQMLRAVNPNSWTLFVFKSFLGYKKFVSYIYTLRKSQTHLVFSKNYKNKI